MITNQQPQNIEAEESLLCELMLSGVMLPEVCEILVAEDFYKPSHKNVFAAIKDLYTKNEPVDLITTIEKMQRLGTLEGSGGAAYVSQITNCPQSMNSVRYAEIIRDKSMLRQMIAKASNAIRACFEAGDSVTEVIDRVHQDILSVRPGGGVDDCFFVSDLIHQRVDFYEEIDKTKRPRGLFVGFSSLDAMTTGLQPGELTIIAARPSMGKTSFARSIIRNVSKRNNGFCTLVFSLEMSKEQLADSDIASESCVNMNKIRFGQASRDDWRHINNACSRMANYRIAVCDKSAPHISEIARISRQMKKKHNVGLIVVDYLQLVVGNHKESRVLEVSDVSRGLKTLARELGVPVVALSQLNRSLEQRSNKRPIMSDLRDSGAIEQDKPYFLAIAA